MVRGKLVRIQGDQLILEPQEGTAQTKAFVPLVLFDLLAIGTSPFVNGFGFGGGFGYGGGFGGPGFFW
ncbi:hypothetical protein HMPREF9413_4677 [Paenibacillus sp. HGF7]|nr:hypothetical protein HMPREF9413_4677 [Paenibacillus sp. HGF7]